MQTSLTVQPLSAAEFCERVVPALASREAGNGLPFGIAQRLATQAAGQPVSAPDALLLGIENAGIVVGGAVWTPPHDVVVTRLPAGAAALVAEQCRIWGAQTVGAPATGAVGPEESALELAEHLARNSKASVRVRVRQRVYELTAVDEVPRAPGAMRRVSTLADAVLVAYPTSLPGTWPKPSLSARRTACPGRRSARL